MGIIGDYKLYRRAKGALKRFKEEAVLNGIPVAVKRFVLVVAPPVVAYVSAACPALFSSTGVVALGGAAIAAVLSGRKSQSAGKATAAGVGSFVGTVALAYSGARGWIDGACGTTFLQQLPTLATTALSLGLAAYMRGTPKAEDGGRT